MEKPVTISQMTLRIAASVIAFVLISLITIGATYISGKTDQKEFDAHREQTLDRFDKMQTQINAQLKVNSELLKTLNRTELKIERIETNTEWLIKEVKK